MPSKKSLSRKVIPMNRTHTIARAGIRTAAITLAACLAIGLLGGCRAEQPKKEADFSNARDIAKLATFECTYHNVARIEKDSSKFFFIEMPDWKQEWFEYSATVDFGIDASVVEISKPNESGTVTITLPQAQVLGEPNIKAETMSERLDHNGWFAKVTDTERKEALTLAQLETYERACADDTMLAAARDRAKVLLEQYVKNVGANLGETYTVKWADAE